MIERVVQPRNLTKAYCKVVSNNGSCGVDGMRVTELASYREENRIKLLTSIINRSIYRMLSEE
jgi:RNA-directed DNA polymerase